MAKLRDKEVYNLDLNNSIKQENVIIESKSKNSQKTPDVYKTFYFGILFMKKTFQITYQQWVIKKVIKKWYLFGFIKFKTEIKS